MKSVPACSIFYYLTNKQSLSNCNVVELFCHPNYKDGVLIDDNPSYLYKDRKTMQAQIAGIRELDGIKIVSWEKQ